MPSIDLTDAELQNAAQAARVAAAQAEHDAARQASSSMRPHFDASAKRYRALSEKFEQARKAGQLSPAPRLR
jgi:uncharacterized protein YhaN